MENSGERGLRVCLIGCLIVMASACSGDAGGTAVGRGGDADRASGGTGDAPIEQGGASGANVSATSAGGRWPVTGGVAGNGSDPAFPSGNGPKGPCPVWRNELFFPLVGVFFYGNNPKPCTRTITPAPDVASSVAGTYDVAYDSAGYVGKMTNRDGTVTYTFRREQNVLVSEVDAKATSQAELTYRYDTDSAGYQTRNGSDLISDFQYTRDAQGYPLTVIAVYYTSPAPPAGRYLYEYEGCRIKQRTAYIGDVLDESQTQIYEYDADGRIIALKSSHATETFDYSCS